MQTVAAINTFLLMMAANPDVQRQAQAEVVRAIGARAASGNPDSTPVPEPTVPEPASGEAIPLPARLPGFGDRAQMPYLEAVFKEVMRFNPGLSMGEHALAPPPPCDRGLLLCC